MIWIDDGRGLEVVGVAQGEANFAHLLAHDWAAASAFARQWGFPEHQLVVRPQEESDSRIRKGISSWAELEDAFCWALGQSASGRVFIETDVRAHASTADPERCDYCNPCPFGPGRRPRPKLASWDENES